MYPGPENWWVPYGGSQFGTQLEDPVGFELGEGRVAATQVAAGVPGVLRWSSRLYKKGGRPGK